MENIEKKNKVGRPKGSKNKIGVKTGRPKGSTKIISKQRLNVFHVKLSDFENEMIEEIQKRKEFIGVSKRKILIKLVTDYLK